MKEDIESKVTGEKIVQEGKWLGMKIIDYQIGDRTQSYEAIFRTTTRDKKLPVDGSDVIPIIKYKNKPSQIVLVAGFRPPVNSFNLQFPAGLNEDEDYQENAKRELRQEAGFVAKEFIPIPNPVTYSDPWKSNQCSKLFIGVIDGDDPNSRVPQQLDSSENIRVHVLKYDENLMDEVQKLITENNYTIESKVWGFVVGLAMKKLIQ